MRRARQALVTGLSIALVCPLAGCPDPGAEFEEFVDRHADVYGTTVGSSGVGGGCALPAVGELDGEYLFSLVVQLSATKPAPLKATLTTAPGATGFEYSLGMQPLSAEDRATEVGAPFTLGPFPVNPDGSFDSDWGTITVPGDTNPISASELVADVQVAGTLCPGDYFCGIANGQVTSPAPIDISGSTWTMESLATFTEPPKLNCAGDLADPL
ncbi:MAG: hypothetical protein JRI23_36095 [Deltaproteobacteria bacterium]|jgi:hypothetical protein|nr:hypothetical protein [Deltaproteobacteria bacterium]MBW2537772.1 hypothetical protein [Deltaproteobacteria bacterium]